MPLDTTPYKLVPTFASDEPPGARSFRTLFPAHFCPVAFELPALPTSILNGVFRINEFVNYHIRYTSEEHDQWTDFDHFAEWTYTLMSGPRRYPANRDETLRGDCEEFALTKRSMLAQVFGYGPLAPLIVRPSGFTTPHMVLALRMENRTTLLDQRVNQLLPLTPGWNPLAALIGDKWMQCVVTPRVPPEPKVA